MNAVVEIDRPEAGTAVQHRQEPSSAIQMISMLERIIMDPSIPMERLERAIAMKNHEEDRAREDRARQAEKDYFGAMSQCQAELPVVTKTQKNIHTKSTYADLAAIETQAMPIIHKHGFGVSFQPDGYGDKGSLRLRWEISHEAGHSRNGIAEIPIDSAGAQGTVNKTGVQAFGSTATYGRRYLLCMLFNISTGDDNDGNASKVIKPAEGEELVSQEQIESLIELLEANNKDEKKFLRWAKLERLSDMPAELYGQFVEIIKGNAGGQS